MNKYIVKGLAATMVGAMVLTGCSGGSNKGASTGNGATASENLEITLWHGYSTDKAEVLGQLAAEYNAQNEGVTIVPEFVASSEDILTKAQTAIMNKAQPDILWGAPTMTGVLQSTGKLVKVDEYIDEEWKNDIPQGLWDVSKYADGMYSVPIEAGTLMLIYNKDMFEAAGITEVPTTWDGLYETAKQLTNDEHQGIWMPIQPDERTTWTWLCFLEQNGGQLLSDDFAEIGFDEATLKETLEYYTKFTTEGISPVSVGQDAFAEGQVAMIIGTQGAANAYINKNNMNVGVTMLPGQDELATGLGTNHYYIFDNGDERVEEAMKFVRWITTGEKHAKWVIAAGYLPVSNTAKESETFKAYEAENPHMGIAADALEYGFARPSIQEYPRISNAISGAIEAIAYGQMTVDEGAQSISEKINDIIK